MFGQKAAVDNVSFSVDRPAFVGIIGRSGAGKSTLLRMMNRLVDASSGEILVEGRNVIALKGAEARDWQAQCAMIFRNCPACLAALVAEFNIQPRRISAIN
jgi:phosphonate transport system ATP-binding protein